MVQTDISDDGLLKVMDRSDLSGPAVAATAAPLVPLKASFDTRGLGRFVERVNPSPPPNPLNSPLIPLPLETLYLVKPPTTAAAKQASSSMG